LREGRKGGKGRVRDDVDLGGRAEIERGKGKSRKRRRVDKKFGG